MHPLLKPEIGNQLLQKCHIRAFAADHIVELFHIPEPRHCLEHNPEPFLHPQRAHGEQHCGFLRNPQLCPDFIPAARRNGIALIIQSHIRQ